MFTYFSVVSAFLIMSHLVAGKLDSFLASTIIVLYSLTCLWFNAGLMACSVDLGSLYAEIVAKKNSGTYELGWFGGNPDWMAQGINVLQLLLTIGGLVGVNGVFLV
jgi:hypothetical protein